MAERRAVTKQMARRYQKASKVEKGTMLDQLCALAGHLEDILGEATGDGFEDILT